LLQIALLNGRHRPVDQQQPDVFCLDPRSDFFQFSFAKQFTDLNLSQLGNLAKPHVQIQGSGKGHCLGQRVFR
jgi:hypothetical protein